MLLNLVLLAGGLMAQEGGNHDRQPAASTAEVGFVALHDAYLARYKPLFLRSGQAWWEATTTGSDEAFARRKEVEDALVELHSDRETFKKLEAWKEGGRFADRALKRQLEVMYNAFLPGQADTELRKRIVEIELAIEQTFNTHRSLVGGKSLTENEVRRILSESCETDQVKEAWTGYMQVGAKVDKKLREVVGLRNRMARQLGFRDFFAMSLALGEVEEADLDRLFDELDDLTRAPFAALKQKIDPAMAARFGIKPTDLRPWHFGDLFFQEVPGLEEVNLDEVYQDQDIIAAAKAYYAGMGLPVDDILQRSDLYERPGKTPHAFAADLDRTGDIRILCNLKPNLYWTDTLLHELGHAVYDKYINPELPFILRTPAHSITTEGYAMMMGAMAKNEEFLTKVLALPPEPAAKIVDAARRALRAEKLIFCRWTQVMVRFEQGMYGHPDQDLSRLWWDLKKRYQLLNPPESVGRPDYAAKIHILTHPVYYHGYMMGDLFACQVQHHIAKKLLGLDDPGTTCFFGREEAGAYLRDKVFAPGKLYSWNELTERATGEPLSAKYFARRYVTQPGGDSGQSPSTARR
jgi:peptidyl-dipeptidase A